MGQALELVERAFHAIEAGDKEAIARCFDAEVVLTLPGTRVEGFPALDGLVDVFYGAFPNMHHTIVGSIESADAVAIELHVTGTHSGVYRSPLGEAAPTGRDFAYSAFGHFRVRDGRIVSWTACFDRLDFLAQLGLLTMPVLS